MTFNLSAKSIVQVVMMVLFCFLTVPLNAYDPPSRVIRVSYMSNPVGFAPAGEDAWSDLGLNRPLYIGDSLWSSENSQTELQLEGAFLYMGGSTNLSITNLDDNLVQLKLTQGRLNLLLQNLEPNQVYEIDTPNLAFTVREPGYYQVNVTDDQSATMVSAARGSAEVYGVQNAFKINEGSAFHFFGNDLADYEAVTLANDDFDNWSLSRATMGNESASRAYVSNSIIGYQDLDNYGQWAEDPSYGFVWYPNQVANDWAPYSDGNWTWVDYQPWGFAPFHYGRWVYNQSRWCWAPGPISARAVYAPALVGFIGADGFNLGLSLGRFYGRGIGWFPLGPSDVYIPPYSVSRNYFNQINRNNSKFINNATLNNAYSNPSRNVVYQNFRSAPYAVTAVPLSAFVHSLPVVQQKVKLTASDVQGIAADKVTMAAPVKPKAASMLGSQKVGAAPPKRLSVQAVVSNKAPPPAVEFSKKQESLTKESGKPGEPAAPQETNPNILPPSKRPIPVEEPHGAPVKKRAQPTSVSNPRNAHPTVEERPRINTAPSEEQRHIVAPPREVPRHVAPSPSREESRAISGSREEPRVITVPREETRVIVAPAREAPRVVAPAPREAPRVVAPSLREAPRSAPPSRIEEPDRNHK